MKLRYLQKLLFGMAPLNILLRSVTTAFILRANVQASPALSQSAIWRFTCSKVWGSLALF